jgi:hypothetical protein
MHKELGAGFWWLNHFANRFEGEKKESQTHAFKEFK